MCYHSIYRYGTTHWNKSSHWSLMNLWDLKAYVKPHKLNLHASNGAGP